MPPAYRNGARIRYSRWDNHSLLVGFIDHTRSGGKGVFRNRTVPVCRLEPNWWGLHNVHGNVYEWCEDVWHNTYIGAPTDESAWLLAGDPRVRVSRGGAWCTGPQYLRSACRGDRKTDVRTDFQGFARRQNVRSRVRSASSRGSLTPGRCALTRAKASAALQNATQWCRCGSWPQIAVVTAVVSSMISSLSWAFCHPVAWLPCAPRVRARCNWPTNASLRLGVKRRPTGTVRVSVVGAALLAIYC